MNNNRSWIKKFCLWFIELCHKNACLKRFADIIQKNSSTLTYETFDSMHFSDMYIFCSNFEVKSPLTHVFCWSFFLVSLSRIYSKMSHTPFLWVAIDGAHVFINWRTDLSSFYKFKSKKNGMDVLAKVNWLHLPSNRSLKFIVSKKNQ